LAMARLSYAAGGTCASRRIASVSVSVMP